MNARWVIALAVPASAIAGALISAVLLNREVNEAERAHASAHADTAKRLIVVCNTVHKQLSYALGVADIERAKDLVLAAATAIEPCSDAHADPGSISAQLASAFTENGDRAAFDAAVRAALRIVPYRYDVDEAPE